MNRGRKQFGFSLTEVLIATGIMAIGLVMVATVFPVGVHLTALTTERTISAIVADEAFAKIQLYGLRDFALWPVRPSGDPSGGCTDFQYASLFADGPGTDMIYGTFDDTALVPDWSEFLYPSTVMPAGQPHNYHWSALCRKVAGSDKEVQVTVFITRKIGSGSTYRDYDPVSDSIPPTSPSPWPLPVLVPVNLIPSSTNAVEFVHTGMVNWVQEGIQVLSGETGNLYRVSEINDVNGDGNKDLIFTTDWQEPTVTNAATWLVPPAYGSDRYPCVGVYQKVIRFDGIN